MPGIGQDMALALLLANHRVRHKVHGFRTAGVAKAIGARRGTPTSVMKVQPVLDGLNAQGLMSKEDHRNPDGRIFHYYRLTDWGQERLREVATGPDVAEPTLGNVHDDVLLTAIGRSSGGYKAVLGEVTRHLEILIGVHPHIESLKRRIAGLVARNLVSTLDGRYQLTDKAREALRQRKAHIT